jgi:hypothetical protein
MSPGMVLMSDDMDEIGRHADGTGMTPELLESLLGDGQ